MQIVIDIPEEKYQGIVNMAKEILDASTFCSPRYLYKAVLNGTPLPKGHGRLIDADTLEECKEVLNTIMNECEYAVRMDEIRNVPTIIGADNAERSDKE